MTTESIICVHVTTHAHSNHVVGWLDGKLHVKVRAVAEKGKANSAVIELLAKHFSVAKTVIKIVSGTTSRNKRIKLPIAVNDQV